MAWALQIRLECLLIPIRLAGRWVPFQFDSLVAGTFISFDCWLTSPWSPPPPSTSPLATPEPSASQDGSALPSGSDAPVVPLLDAEDTQPPSSAPRPRPRPIVPGSSNRAPAPPIERRTPSPGPRPIALLTPENQRRSPLNYFSLKGKAPSATSSRNVAAPVPSGHTSLMERAHSALAKMRDFGRDLPTASAT